MSDNIVKKRKRISKNKKKNWRKSDISEVEEHLEDVRLQERTGGVVADKTDEQLFFVDKVDITVPLKRRKKEVKPLKCEAHLQPDPNTKPFKISHNVLKEENRLKRKSIRVLTTNKPQTQVNVKSIEQRQQSDAARKKVRANRKTQPTADRDLWADGQPESLTKDQFFLQYTKKTRVKPPSHLQNKSSELPAVETPLPGQSYNPTFTDHQRLLRSAHDVELKKLKEEKKLQRSLDGKYQKCSLEQRESMWISEMSSGLADGNHSDDNVTYTEEELSRVSINPPVKRDNKKTEKQRRKDQERKEKLKKTKAEKLENIRKDQLTSQLKSVKKDILKEEAKHQQRLTTRQQQRIKNKKLPQKLGKLKYEEPDMELKLTNELVGSLRELKPEGHLLEDRYKSLQKRNILEPRKRAKIVRKYKVKYMEKKTHKEVTI